ncbi:MAG: hypothetical protein KAI17_10845, partial [Thiotrichaceae bacterium]|nr:hypothetical protein [Thiotrichaceae bacterium]
MINQHKINIVAFGINQQTRSIFEMIFRGPGKGGYILIEDIQSAHACVFDLDNIEGMKLWKEYRSSLPTIILSLEHKDVVGTIYVKKPIEIDKLIKAFEKTKQLIDSSKESDKPQKVPTKSPALAVQNVKLATEIAIEKEEESLQQFCGSHPDIDPVQPKEYKHVFYEPKQYMQGFFEKAIDVSIQTPNKGILLEGLYTPMVLFYRKNKIFSDCNFTERSIDLLRTMTLLPVKKSALRMTFLTEKEIENYVTVNQLAEQAFDNFFWRQTLWTARGCVPNGIDLNKIIILPNWPNFTRLIVTPYALKISALWLEQPHSLLETAKILDIPQRYVFAFFSAAYANRLAFLDRRVKQEKLPKGMVERRIKRSTMT